ncbi:GSCOCG00006901001-RA-CDS, partial [Cotesia congregata]
NILPVLVEHLRSALELTSASTKRSLADEPLAPDPLHNSQDSSATPLSSMDFNLFGDLLVSDIKTALVRLQDTLKRVDVDALTRYSATLESNDKLRLLQLISNLVSNLKLAKLSSDEEPVAVPPVPPVPAAPAVKKRFRGKDRHTIGVSSEELARARRWLEEKGTGVSLTSQRLSLAPQFTEPGKENAKVERESSEKMCDKHIKDKINQQQLQNRKDNDVPASESDIGDKLEEPVNFLNINNKVASNKFTAKKFKIKRANTIDIPNYLKLQAEKSQSSSPGLRRPIDIGDRLSWNQGSVLIPSFEPKTENDRKFLALINRNNNDNNINNNFYSNNVNTYNYSNGNSFNQPFKSFNYRQTSSIADKNWKSRFSNIKTAFDKPSPPASVDGSSRRSSISREESKHVIVGSLRLKPEPSAQKNNFGTKNGTFTHAATSPFQKINNKSINCNNSCNNDEKPTPSYYLPACASNGMLRAKLKMFDQQDTLGDPLPRVKSKANTKVNVKPEKIIKDTALNHCQNQIRNNGFRNSSYDNVKRHSGVYDSNGNITNHLININNNVINDDKKVQGQDIQKQSVAVQTNYPIELNDVENESLIRSCPRQLHNPKYQSVPRTFYENENPIYVPPKPVPTSRDIDFLVDANYSNRFIDDESENSFLDDENIANQDISDDRIVTRYTSAIATVENSPISPASVSPSGFQEGSGQPVLSDDVQRHNLLQQSLIRRLQYEPDSLIKPIQAPQVQLQPQPLIQFQPKPQPQFQPQPQNQFQPQTQFQPQIPVQFQPKLQNQLLNQNPRYSLINYTENTSPINEEPTQNGRESIEPLIESRNTLEKINIFEEKSTRRPEPLVIRPIYVPPKINIMSPSKTTPQSPKLTINPYVPSLPVKYSTPVDSSDEYLVNCATRPHRSIVLSKSESWHQLALSKNHLQVPPPAVPTHKPPRVSSKNFHGESADRNMKKMEEKVQRYFYKSEGQKRESSSSGSGKRRSFSPRKNNLTLARSHTMPHIYDDATDKPMSPFAKFRELDRQNSSSTPSTPRTPGTPKEFTFKFTDPVVQNNAVQIKERLLSWCRAKTKEYENVQIDNFSTSWNNGLAFCALLHHFKPEAFDYDKLKPENRRKNFTLAFEKAE